jgi:uncharacterized membrane protein
MIPSIWTSAVFHKIQQLLVFNSLLQILIFSDPYDFFGLALYLLFIIIYWICHHTKRRKKITLTKITMWQENGTGLSSHLKPNPLQYTQYTICLYSTIYTLHFCIHFSTI